MNLSELLNKSKEEKLLKAGKDISKLAKKVITDKNGHRRTVYVKTHEEKKSLFQGLIRFFDFKNNDADKFVNEQYEQQEIKKKFSISAKDWGMHLNEYFKNKDKWTSFFKKTTGNKPKGTVAKFVDSGKKKNKKNTKNTLKLSVMKFIHEAYGGNKYEQYKPRPESGKISGAEQAIQGGQASKTSYGDLPEKQPGADRAESVLSSVQPGDRPRNDVRLTKKQTKDLRQRIHDLLNSKEDHEMTDEDKALLRQYEGAGGLGEEGATTHGTLHEFYTPETIVNKMWNITEKYIGRNAKVLEPSAGIGRFGEREGHSVDMIEIDPTSARINRILHPECNVYQGAFQDLFFKDGVNQKKYTGKKYDCIIGNPPYGQYSGIHKGRGEGADHKRYEEYFMDRGLDLLEDGGVMTFIVPSAFMRNWNNSKIKEKIAAKGKLMEAWRLPNGTFSTTGVGTDILVIRKEKGNVNSFIGDDYFNNNPEHILGEEVTKTGRFGPEKYVQTKENMTFMDVFNLLDENKIMVPDEVGQKTLSEEAKHNISLGLKGNDNAKKMFKKEKKISKKKEPEKPSAPKETQSSEEFSKRYHKSFSAHELEIWKATNFDGSIDINNLPAENKKIFLDSEFYCTMNGKVFHSVNYASGNIYEKLQKLEEEKSSLTKEQYERQKRILMDVLPEKKTVKNITISPISTYAQRFNFGTEEEPSMLIDKFYKWATGGEYKHRQNFDAGVTQHDLPAGIGWSDILAYINQDTVRADRGGDSVTNKMRADRTRELRRVVGEKLFKRFLESGLSKEEQEKLEQYHNKTMNSNVEPDYSKIPMFVDGISKTFKDKELVVKDIQMKGASFLCNKGNGLLAYDVGVGKTLTAILATVNQLKTGRAKKPVICVPKAVYSNWLYEIKELFPDIEINDLGNLGSKYIKGDKDPEIKEGTLSVVTYEALQNLTFTDETLGLETVETKEGPKQILKPDSIAWDILESQKTGDEGKSDRDKANETEKILAKVGRGSKVKSKQFFIEDFGFDHITVDEVHNFKNVFGKSKPLKRNGKQTANEFSEITGGESDRAMKMFAVTQYIQKENNDRNVFTLSATPFTNSPLEIYNILSLVARKKLKDLGIYNLHEFMARFAKIQSEWAVNAKGDVVKKGVMKEFQNLQDLQALITEYIDKVDGDEAGIVRPNKKTHLVELPMSAEQKALIKAEQKRFEALPEDEPGAVLKAINNLRMSTVSMTLVNMDKYNEHIDTTGLHLIDDSPKLNFTFNSAAKIYKERSDVGQVIYMPRGVDNFSAFRDYLVTKGVPKDAIGMIHSKVSDDKKDAIKSSFNDPEGKIKIVIGSETIQEGINLNGNSAVLYNTLLGWNPSERHQVEGRIWRQGNKQENVHIVYPQMVDSVDCAMYQKHDEKGARFEQIWSYKGDNLNVKDISAEDLKFDLIKDPEKRAEMTMNFDLEKFDGMKRDLRIQIDILKKYKKDSESVPQTIQYYQKRVTSDEETLKGYEVDLKEAEDNLKKIPKAPKTGEDEHRYERQSALRSVENEKGYVKRQKDSIKRSKNEIKDAEIALEVIHSKLADRGLSLNTIDLEIQKLDEQIEDYHKQETEIKSNKDKYLQEAKEAIEKNQKEVPTVEESINTYSDLILSDLKEKDMTKAIILVGDRMIKAELLPGKEIERNFILNGELLKVRVIK